MFKVIMFIKRKPEITHEAFREHYESSHVPLVLKALPSARGYTRNFIKPDLTVEGFDFDCLTELLFDNEADWKAAAKQYAASDEGKTVAADEDNFIDRKQTRLLMAEECASAISDRSVSS